MVEEPLRDGVCFVPEGLSSRSWRSIFASREAAVNVSQSYSDAAFVSIDDILECCLGATRAGRQLIFKLRLWARGRVEGRSFAKGHGGINGLTA